MAKPDLPTAPPAENKTPRQSGVTSEAWIMKGLNDLRDDMREIKGAVRGLDTRVGSLETKIMRVFWTVAGGIAFAMALWAIFQFSTKYFDIQINLKGHEESVPVTPTVPNP